MEGVILEINSFNKIMKMFVTNLSILHDAYVNNEDFVNKKAVEYLARYNEFAGNENDEYSNTIKKFYITTVMYSLYESSITQMYHLFEQFIKMVFSSSIEDRTINYKVIKDDYGYDYKKNSYYDLVDKYRLINNAIKHGGIKELSSKYPELTRNCTNDCGTIMDDVINLSSDNIDECYDCLYHFALELDSYFKDMGIKPYC